jgi:hypothetical protein
VRIIDKMQELGFDSVFVEKIYDGFYKIDIARTNSFEEFTNQESNT